MIHLTAGGRSESFRRRLTGSEGVAEAGLGLVVVELETNGMPDKCFGRFLRWAGAEGQGFPPQSANRCARGSLVTQRAPSGYDPYGGLRRATPAGRCRPKWNDTESAEDRFLTRRRREVNPLTMVF